MNVTIKGLDKVLSKLDASLIDVPLQKFFNRATLTVANKTKQNTPVDRGLLRVRILTEVNSREAKVGWLEAQPGSDLFYQARAMEYGTGSQGDPDVSHKAGHFPPPAALDLWAARHGFASGFIVARAIARRGGLKPRRMLREGLKESMSAIQGFIKQLEEDIKTQWDNR